MFSTELCTHLPMMMKRLGQFGRTNSCMQKFHLQMIWMFGSVGKSLLHKHSSLQRNCVSITYAPKQGLTCLILLTEVKQQTESVWVQRKTGLVALLRQWQQQEQAQINCSSMAFVGTTESGEKSFSKSRKEQ